MISRAIAWAALLLASSAAPAAPVVYAIDAAHTQVLWEARHFGTSTQRGRFAQIEGHIAIDRDSGDGEVSISIATGSVSSGVAALDGMLRSRHFLASEDHPTAYFVARRLRFDGAGLQELHGEFTLRGVSRPLTLRATRFACRIVDGDGREVCGGDFEAEIRRSDFGSTYGLPFVGDEVRLLVAVEGLRR
ncbi:MAG TPA: YceI family protein [Albitalea sp.]